GGSQQALSVDIAPYWLAFGHLIDRETYRANAAVRLLSRIELSLVTKAASSSEYAGAASMRLFDLGDPRLDNALADCLARAAHRVLEAAPPCREDADCAQENTR